jgi:hypothetical protein
MSASMYDIDRNTHLKILIVGSAAAMIVVAVAANARSPGSHGPAATTAPAIYVTPPQRPQIAPPRKPLPSTSADTRLADILKPANQMGLRLPTNV